MVNCLMKHAFFISILFLATDYAAATLVVEIQGVPGSGRTTWSFSGSTIAGKAGYFESGDDLTNHWRSIGEYTAINDFEDTSVHGDASIIVGGRVRPIGLAYVDSDAAMGEDDFGVGVVGPDDLTYSAGDRVSWSGTLTASIDVGDLASNGLPNTMTADEVAHSGPGTLDLQVRIFDTRSKDSILRFLPAILGSLSPTPVPDPVPDPVPPPQSGALNDTGIDWCADEDTNVLPCPVGGYPDQDAQYGRDLTHDDDSDGHAGFSFTKLDANGDDLPAGATSWSCVRDNVTGLVWEFKTDDGGLRDKDWTYSWYNPDGGTNGGSTGKRDGGVCGGGIDCDTHAFVAAVNAEGLCGRNDWRLPDRFELESITSNDRTGPAIDTGYFPYTRPSSFFWSSSPTAYGSGSAWTVHIVYGSVNGYGKSAGLYVRLVRAGK